MSIILELYTNPTDDVNADWPQIVSQHHCAYLGRGCVKARKSQPDISIGTCSVRQGVRSSAGVIICPHRFLERRQIFTDCIHLLTLHEPGNELHLISEVSLPGGNVDYVLVSARNGKVVDFVGIELQALDTTGTLWPPRQRFLRSQGLSVSDEDTKSTKGYGMNWKMTAKTTLVQLHHKVETFEHINKHFVLVLQDGLLDYLQSSFNFGHIKNAKLGDAMHFHAYSLASVGGKYKLSLSNRLSTDANGIATALGLQVSARVELEVIIATLQAEISDRTLLTI